MRQVLHLKPEDARRVPWKNGRGVTEELALWPPHASFERGDFEWRISKARIVEDGPFSRFEQHDRIIVVTDGDGLTLAHGDEAPRVRLRSLEPYSFRGDWTTVAELQHGPVADFNVMSRRDRVEASVDALRLGSRRTLETLSAGHAFVHALRGRVVARVVGEEEPFTLEAGESLWIPEIRSDEDVDLAGKSPDSALLLVRIRAPRAT